MRELLRPVPPPVGGARAEDDGRVAADTAPGPAEGMSATDTLSAIPLLPPPTYHTPFLTLPRVVICCVLMVSRTLVVS